MGGFLIAALVGEGILVFRSYKASKRLPLPGEILGVSGLFVILGILAEWEPGLATMLAVGLDLAGLLNAWPTTSGSSASSGQPQYTAPLPKQGPVSI